MKREIEDTNCMTSIIAVNLTEKKMYSYSQSGLLLKRYVFKNEVKQYGKPIKTSPNGLNFVFKKTKH